MQLYSSIILLVIYLILPGCTRPRMMEFNELPSIQHIDDDSITVDLNNKYLPLLDIIERMQVFIEERIQEFKAYQDGDSKGVSEKFKKFYVANEQAHKNQIAVVEDLYNQTLALLSGKKDIDGYLYHLLGVRMSYLKNRKETIKAVLLDEEGKFGLFFYPTNKELFELIIKQESSTLNSVGRNKVDELIHIHTVRCFELFNLLIRESFKKCNLEELSSETIRLLRASVQLHPILTGDRRDLGHPDEAGGYYALLEKLLLSSHQDKWYATLEPLFKVKLEAEQAVGKFNERKENLHSPLSNIGRIRFLAQRIHRSKKDLACCQAINEIMRDLDVAHYKAHFIRKEHFIPFANHWRINPGEKGVKTLVTNYEVGRWPYELPYPTFLQKKEEKVCLEDYSFLGDTDTSMHAEQQYGKAATVLLAESKNIQKGEVALVVASAMPPPQSVPQVSKQAWKEEGVVEKGTTYSSIRVIPALEKQENGQIVKAPSQAWTFERDWILPKGLRSFHRQMLKCTYQVRKVNKYQDVVDRLFDSEQQSNVSFREFRALWKSIGGEIIENHGGSHKQLIGPFQEDLFGIFAHGNNQTYGSEYVKYLQTALLYVGLRPTKWA